MPEFRPIAFLVGAVFGLGLCISGMTNPAKVLAFLDFAGAWDPSLALVMAGAIAVAFFGFRFAERRAVTLLGQPIEAPPRTPITLPLVAGALLFGVGWGLVGLCPGPAIADLGFLDWRAALFVVSMAVGMRGFSAAAQALGGFRQTESLALRDG